MRALAVLVVCFAALAFVWIAIRPERAVPPKMAEIRSVSTPVTEPLASVERAQPADVRVAVAPDTARVPAVEPHVVELAAPSSSSHCSIVGRALDDQGMPVEGALVTLAVFGTGTQAAPRGTVHTDSDGRFVFDLPAVVPTGARVKLSVSGTSFHAPTSRAEPRVWKEGSNDVGDFVLVLSGVMRGRVIDSMGVPIDSAIIDMSPALSGRRTALTTPKGVFRLRDLPAGSYAIEARASGYSARTLTALEVRVGEETVVPDIVLASAPSIRGSVVDEEGRVVDRVRIEGRSVRTGEKSTTKSKPDGSFVLYLPSDGLTVLGVSGDERGYQDWGGTDGPGVTFRAGASDVRIALKHLPRMRFVVVDRTRAPIERFEMILSQARPGIGGDRQETVMLGNHPRGEVRLPLRKADRVAVRAPGFVPVELPIVPDRAGSDVQTIELAPAAMISGRLRVLGAPIADGNVSIELEDSRDEASEEEPERRLQFTKRTGEFSFDELGPGTYTLRVKGAGGTPKTLAGIVVTSEQHLQLGDLDLDPAAIVRVVVLTDARESATHFGLKLDERNERVIPTKDARFEFKNVAAGEHTLVWSRRNENTDFVDAGSRTVKFTVGVGETRDIVIDARPSTPCLLTFRVLRNGMPVPNVGLRGSLEERRTPGQSTFLATTDANGDAHVRLEPHRSVRVDVANDAEHYLGTLGRMLALVPGGSVNEVIQIETGRLVVALPEGLSPPQDGYLVLGFKDHAQPTSSAKTPKASVDQLASPDVNWTSRTIDFGEYATGSYDVSLSFRRVLREEGSRYSRDEELYPDHKERIEIRNGAVTRIVVP